MFGSVFDAAAREGEGRLLDRCALPPAPNTAPLPRQAMPARCHRSRKAGSGINYRLFSAGLERPGESTMAERRLKHFGWGREGEGMTAEEVAAALDRYRRLFAVERFDEVSPPALAEIELRPPRLVPPRALAAH